MNSNVLTQLVKSLSKILSCLLKKAESRAPSWVAQSTSLISELLVELLNQIPFLLS